MANINRVVISGNLTKDPELRQLPSGNSVCKLRMAVNTRVKDRDSGQWTDKPNYFDVTVWGAPGRERGEVPLARLGPARRRPARVARVGCPGRHQAPGGRDHRREHPVHGRPRKWRRRRWRRRASGRRLRPRPAAPPCRRRRRSPTTTTFRSDRGLSDHGPSPTHKQDEHEARAAPAAPQPAAASARSATSARTRSKRWTTRTRTPSGATSRRRARSARAASRARAAVTRTRWPWRSSGPARWRCCRTRRA